MSPWMVFAFTFVFISQAWAGSLSCLPDHTALQVVELIDPRKTKEISHFLKIETNGRRIDSKVQMLSRSLSEDNQAMEFILRFDPDFDGVSLPFNLYSVLVVREGEVVAWWDYSNGCEGPGVALFPGGEVRLPKLKMINDRVHKLQIMVWGRL